MDELISYDQLSTLLKNLAFLLLGSDSFSFLQLKDQEVDVFCSENDMFIKLESDVNYF